MLAPSSPPLPDPTFQRVTRIGAILSTQWLLRTVSLLFTPPLMGGFSAVLTISSPPVRARHSSLWRLDVVPRQGNSRIQPPPLRYANDSTGRCVSCSQVQSFLVLSATRKRQSPTQSVFSGGEGSHFTLGVGISRRYVFITIIAAITCSSDFYLPSHTFLGNNLKVFLYFVHNKVVSFPCFLFCFFPCGFFGSFCRFCLVVQFKSDWIKPFCGSFLS